MARVDVVMLVIVVNAYSEKDAQLWVIEIAHDEAVKRHNLACFFLPRLDTFTS